MIIRINAKCSDQCHVEFEDVERNDYVPRNIGIGGGDYISLSIDAKTGQILNWPSLDKEEIIEALKN